MEQSSAAEGRRRVKLITRIKTGYAAAQTTQTSPLVFVWGGNTLSFPQSQSGHVSYHPTRMLQKMKWGHFNKYIGMKERNWDCSGANQDSWFTIQRYLVGNVQNWDEDSHPTKYWSFQNPSHLPTRGSIGDTAQGFYVFSDSRKGSQRQLGKHRPEKNRTRVSEWKGAICPAQLSFHLAQEAMTLNVLSRHSFPPAILHLRKKKDSEWWPLTRSPDPLKNSLIKINSLTRENTCYP